MIHKIYILHVKLEKTTSNVVLKTNFAYFIADKIITRFTFALAA